MDRIARLLEGAAGLGVTLTAAQAGQLWEYVDLLLRWNSKINLTSIVGSEEILDLHLLDCLALAPMVQAGPVLDAGAGGGFPGIPLHLARPDLEVWLVDSVQKKVAFLKAVTAQLGLRKVQARAIRLEGTPAAEGLPIFAAAVSRAFRAPTDWLPLARQYVRPGGSIFCFLGQKEILSSPPPGLVEVSAKRFRLPRSGAMRSIVEYRVESLPG
jgi:16S rRNA (guanine527-N7)-methyltransferase